MAIQDKPTLKSYFETGERPSQSNFADLVDSFFNKKDDNVISAGTEWTNRTTPVDNDWFSICYGNGLFVAVAHSGTGNRVMTSPDGINWTGRTSATDNYWISVCYGNGLFVAVASSGTGNRVMTSPDGINWTSRTSAADNDWRAVVYGNGLFVAIASTGTGNRVMTSPDGITWTIRTSPANNFWGSVCYGNGLFVAVAGTGTGNRVMTSPDGITWTSRTSAANNFWSSVCYGNGLFVAVAASGTGNRVMTSPDGITWTIRTSAADNNWGTVCYGNGLFVAVAVTGTGNRVMTSLDGITWTIRTSPVDNSFASVAYGNGLFVAVSQTGTGNRAMTSGRQEININFSPSITYLSAALTSLNGLTGATQTFATGTSGTDFGISSSGTVHTFNLPTASASNRGLLSTTDWNTFNNKMPAMTGGVAGQVRFDSGASTTSSSSGLFWDTVNSRLGISTGTPSAKLHIISTTESLRLGYDASSYTTFTITASGSLIITPTTGNVVIANNLILNGQFYTNNSNGIIASNLGVGTAGSASASTTQAQLLFGGATNVNFRICERGSTTTVVGISYSYASHIIGIQPVTIAASGVHNIFAQMVIKALSINAGAGSVANSSSLYIEGAATGATNNYALWIGGGPSKLDGSLSLPYAAKTAAYTLTASDYTIDCTTGTFTVTLPLSTGATGRIYVIKNSGTGTITVGTTSSELIDAGTTKTLSVQYGGIIVQSTGTKWIVTGTF